VCEITELQKDSSQIMQEYNKTISTICGKRVHILPFFLTIPDVNVNVYGLYTKYIPCGAYICKMFDYYADPYDQCTLEEINDGKCTADYSYIGGRYDNIFPLKQVLVMLSDTCDVSYEHDSEHVFKPLKRQPFTGFERQPSDNPFTQLKRQPAVAQRNSFYCL
jgi:hypothetical protein